jgi:hypothetical protein
MILTELFEEKVRLDPKCWTGKKIGTPKTKMKGGTRVNNCVPAESLNELAPPSNPNGGNYLKALASAWYNGTFNTGDLHKGIKSQEDVERILERGIHCGDGKIRKYYIGYNAAFDGVEIQSDDHYEHADYDDAGRDIDSRTGQPWGPYDVVEFGDRDLDEGVAEGEVYDLEKEYGYEKPRSQPRRTAPSDYPYSPQEDDAYFNDIFRKKRLAAQQAERTADHDRLATGTNEGQFPDTSNSLAKRTVRQAEVPNVTKNASGHPTVQGRADSTRKTYATRVEPTITSTKVQRKDDRPIPSFLQKGVAEGSEDKIKQLKADHATAVHWSKNDTNPHKREAARQMAEKIKAHLEKQYKQGVAEGNKKPAQPEADYGNDYQDMVTRMKKLAGLGPLKTVYDPTKRVYRNVPTAVQPKR